MAESNRIDWKFPDRDRSNRKLAILAGGAAIIWLISVADAWNHVIEWPAVIGCGVVMCAFMGVLYFNRKATDAAIHATYYADDEGIHKSPGFTIPWSEIQSLDLIVAKSEGTRIMMVRTGKALQDRYLAVASSSIDETKFREFVDARLASPNNRQSA